MIPITDINVKLGVVENHCWMQKATAYLEK